MEIIYSTKFFREYKRLPLNIKKLAEKRQLIFLKNPFDPRLKTHRLTGKLKDYWSFSIDYKHRIIFELRDRNEVWFHSVGTHAIYR